MEKSEPSVEKFKTIKSNSDFQLYKLINSEEISVSSKTDSDQQISSQKHTSREFKNSWEKTLPSTMKSEMHNKTSDFPLDRSQNFKISSRIFMGKTMNYAKS